MFKTIGQVASYKPLYRCDIEELAAIQITRPSGGMLFARNPDRQEKDHARQLIIDLFVRDAWPSTLRILTMPGLDWRFERKLLGKREGNWMAHLAHPQHTVITSIENDRFIYYSAAHQMPGLHTRRALTKIIPAPSYAERTISTRFIKHFHFANVDDLMRETDQAWDAAWLDYTGPLTVERLHLIAGFFERSVRSTLIVTALKARWNRATSDAIERAGGHSAWLTKHLHGQVLHDVEYFDTSPMAQFAIRRPA
ncbi:MAG: hypothetical protein KGL39_59785 [Patescibacteria group bacterium]|nr:hypothetical protein [Patescibacteria group bacterium]